MRIINKTRNTILAEEVFVADNVFKRLCGLLGKKEFKKGKGLILKPCNCAHTFFMNFAIDILFIDVENKVIALQSNLKPWKVSPLYWGVKFALELPAGVIAESRTSKGDEIIFS